MERGKLEPNPWGFFDGKGRVGAKSMGLL